MKIVKVTNMGKLDIVQTIKLNFAPRVPANKRESLSEIIARRKRAERDVRLVQLF